MDTKQENTGPGWLWPAAKVVIALALILFGALLLIPRMVEITSVDAVITARLVTVRSPVAGVLSIGNAVPGAWIEYDSAFARVESKATDTSALQQVQTEIAQQTERLQSVEGQYLKLVETGKKLEAEGNAAKKAEILIAQGNLENAAADLRRRLEILRATAQREGDNIGKKEKTAIAAPVSGVLWRLHESNGSHVAQLAPVAQFLDAGTIYVDASVHKNDLQYLKLGDSVRVKPIGRSESFDGTIQTLLAPSAFGEREDFAGGGPTLHGDEYRVLIKLDISAEQKPQAAALMAGTRATVHFGRRTNALDILFTLSR